MAGNFFQNLMFIALIAAVIGYWWTGMRAKETAVAHAKRLCKRESVQLLDQTVALKKLRLGRDKAGNACLRREYRFEFTVAGEHRDQGKIVLNGKSLHQASLPFTRDEDGNRVFLQ